MFILCLCLAPSPIYKPTVSITQSNFSGYYYMDWYGTPFETLFASDGYYYAWYLDRDHIYEGRWTLKGDILTVKEWVIGSDMQPNTWWVSLKRDGKHNIKGRQSMGILQVDFKPMKTPKIKYSK